MTSKTHKVLFYLKLPVVASIATSNVYSLVKDVNPVTSCICYLKILPHSNRFDYALLPIDLYLPCLDSMMINDDCQHVDLRDGPLDNSRFNGGVTACAI